MLCKLISGEDIIVNYDKVGDNIIVELGLDFDNFYKLYCENDDFWKLYSELQLVGIIFIEDDYVSNVNLKLIELKNLRYINDNLRELSKKFVDYVNSQNVEVFRQLMLNEDSRLEVYETFNEFFNFFVKHGILDFLVILVRVENNGYNIKNSLIKDFYLCFCNYISDFLDDFKEKVSKKGKGKNGVNKGRCGRKLKILDDPKFADYFL